MDYAFWQEVGYALQRILGACVLILAHWGLERVIALVASGTDFPQADSVIRIYFYLAFRVIAIRLVLDAVIFLGLGPLPIRQPPAGRAQ